MKRVAKTSAADLAAEVLRTECAAGQWADCLPGVRILALRLGVSPPTVAAALAQLVAQGVLVGGGERRAFRVAPTRSTARSQTAARKPKRLLILTPEEFSQLSDTTRSAVEILRSQMAAKGWLDDFQVLDFRHAKKPLRSWDRTIQADPDTAVIAIHGRVPLAEWALKRNLRMLFLDWKTLVAAFCFLAHQRVRVPADVSLVLLNNLAEAEWFQPELARFRFPVRRMVKAIARWLEDHSALPDTTYFAPEFIIGQTLAKPGN